jgi:predicted PurR-regulated permease PerM
METRKTRLTNYDFENIVDILIRLVVLYLLISLCFDILKPFGSILLWATVIALAVYPGYIYFVKLFRGRKIAASVFITLLMLTALVIPAWLITESMINGIESIRGVYNQGQPLIPPPGEMTKNWPAFAKPIIDLWNLASTNLQGLTMQFKDQIEVAGNWLFTELAGIGKNILQFLASIFLAGVFLVYSEPISKSIVKIFKKVAGKNGEKFATLSVVTVRNVFKSVIGVAFIQATLASIGFFIAGVPYAGLWTILCLITGIIQLGVWIIVIPISVYMFMATGTLTAILFAVWIIFVALSDNFIKPILMGRGAPVPMMVIFLGSIGGFIYTGFIGLFMGAIVLSIGYKLFMAWVETEN